MTIHCSEYTNLFMATALQLFMSFKSGYAGEQNSCSLGDTTQGMLPCNQFEGKRNSLITMLF